MRLFSSIPSIPFAVVSAGLAASLMQLLSATAVPAVTPDEVLQDAKLEARARDVSSNLRCVVCQNQSIDDSNAPLARDLRLLVRERLAAGDTDQQATDFIVARYGNFVLLRPPVQWNTLLLWFGPALLLVVATLVLGRYLRRQCDIETPPSATALSVEEQAWLDALLEEGTST